MPLHIKKKFLLFSLLSIFTSMSVYADEASDVSKLLRTGQISLAMQKVDVALVARPKDAQLRFLKGLILTEQAKPSEAIIVFSKLKIGRAHV